jgi:PadR family transcriptional regulator PadR
MNTLSQLKKGALEHCVLAVIAAAGKRYGYEIVRVLSDKGLITYEGTIYPLLSRLKKDGLVTTSWESTDKGAPRKYYQITEQGSQSLAAFRTAWQDFHRTVNRILEQEDDFGELPQ